jgi:parallel beta-helix repeat protein
VIRNGFVVSWGGSGVRVGIDGGRLEQIHARSNGAWGISIVGGSYMTIVEACSAYATGLLMINTGGFGMGGDGITLTKCTAQSNVGNGIQVGTGIVSECTSRYSSGNGFSLGWGSKIINCVAANSSQAGIVATTGCTVSGNNSFSNVQAGILVSGPDSRIEGNNVTTNAFGIQVTVSGNLIVRNSASGNTTNYSIAAGNANAQVLTPGANFVSTDPWANFAY